MPCRDSRSGVRHGPLFDLSRPSLMTASKPLRVCSFESRRGDDMRSLLERQGAVATIAPSMREVPIDRNAEALAFGEALLAGRIDTIVFLTGVGARALLDVLETKHPRDAVFAALNAKRVVVRGPKPVAVLREWGVRIDHRAPEPNTWRELLATLDAEVPLKGTTLALQEYGLPNHELTAALESRGAAVVRVPVYRWELPENVEPLKAAVHGTIAGEFDALLFTSAQQIHHVLQVAESMGLREAWIAAARGCCVGSIGPTCSEALREEGLEIGVEASPPKMGHLVKAVVEAAAAR